MKNTTKILIGIVVIIVALAIYAIFFGKAQAPQTIVPVQTIPSNWQTYTDPASGVSVKAPSGLTSTTTAQNGYSLIFPTTTPYVNTHLLHEIRIDITASTTGCNSYISDLGMAATTSVAINGVNFERGLWSDAAAGSVYGGVGYKTTRGNLCYYVVLFTRSTNGEGFYTSDQDQIKKIDALQAIDIKDLFALFDQIATTIKFTK